jgi:hypothetical protein
MSAGHFAKSLKGNLMRIAVISTAYKPTPTRGYGGIERVVNEHFSVWCIVKNYLQLYQHVLDGKKR